MPDKYTQANLPIRAKSELDDDDALMLERFTGTDALSECFEYSLDLVSVDADIKPADVLLKPIVVTVELRDGGERHFHGIVRRFVQGGRTETLVTYRAEVVPKLWFLSLATNCRIFQKKTVKDIIEAVLKEHQITGDAVSFNLTGSYKPREYCVQYRETDFAFISRLMEEEGIYYFFTHTQSGHKLVIADAPTAMEAGPSPSLQVNLYEGGNFSKDYITSIEIENRTVSGKVHLTDYNFETPSLSLQSTVPGSAPDYQKFRLYDYPGGFGVVGEANRLARVRVEEAESLAQVVAGATSYRGLNSGQKISIEEHYRDDVNADYHVLSATHVATQTGYRSRTGGSQFTFETTFELIPAAVHYRPTRVTPKAIVHGTQTAVVVGPAGEEIYVDKFGRVKVHFFWDELGAKDDTSSCWVRVSSTWAGKNWGFIQIPRIGQEVIIDFLEGDPDRPIITGRVYNAEQMPPWELPGNMTQSGTLTRSTKGGAAANANELRFEDKKGSEQVYLHAEKNQDIEVENDETHWVGHDRKKTIDNDETTKVKRDRTETVDRDESITIGNNRTESVGKDEKITIAENRTEDVGKEEKITIGGGRTEDVGKDETISIGGSRNEKVAKDESIKIDGKKSLQIQKDYTTKVSMGNVDTKVDMGNVSLKAGLGKINNEAMQSIEFKVGGSSIKIDQMGVTIKGMMVKVEGQIMTEVKGLLTSVKADAILMVKGSLTMIN